MLTNNTIAIITKSLVLSTQTDIMCLRVNRIVFKTDSLIFSSLVKLITGEPIDLTEDKLIDTFRSLLSNKIVIKNLKTGV